MKETEAMLTIVERLRDAALFYRSNRPSVDHEKRIPRTQEITERECDEIAEREEAAIAEIERLQSELNTALERVKVLEDGVVTLNAVLNELWGHKNGGDIARQMGLEMLDKIMAAQNNAYSCVSRETRDRAVLQSTGGK